MSQLTDNFVLGLDLDGVCADFYGAMREIAAEWFGRDIQDLPEDVTYSMPEWGLPQDDRSEEYKRLHTFAVRYRNLFSEVEPIDGAPQALRRLSNDHVRIRIITHRLYVQSFHELAVSQTVRWLEHHGIPYWDLCFMRDKSMVDANVYLEDAPGPIQALQEAGRDVITFSNSTNRSMRVIDRAGDWTQAEHKIRAYYHRWQGETKDPGSGKMIALHASGEAG